MLGFDPSAQSKQLKDRIGCRMKLNDLHVLMAVVQAGSMGKAATVLNTGQPAISRAIADLERALGVRLLDRDQRGAIELGLCVSVDHETTRCSPVSLATQPGTSPTN